MSYSASIKTRRTGKTDHQTSGLGSIHSALTWAHRQGVVGHDVLGEITRSADSATFRLENSHTGEPAVLELQRTRNPDRS